MATKNTRYVTEERHADYDETDYPSYPADHSGPDAEASEPRCASCGELLAWHESACAAPVAAEPEVAVEARPPRALFAYELGHQVRPMATEVPRIVTWRGQLKERHPATGMVHRVPVYRLDDGYWDCYREEELQVA